MTENTVNKYLDAVSKNLICSRKEKKSFISKLSAGIEDFTGGREDISFEELSAEFGSPRELAASFAAQMDSAVLVKKISIKRAVVLGIIAGIVLMILGMFIGVKCYQRWEFFAHPDGYVLEYPVYVFETEEEVSEYEDMMDDDLFT